MTRPEWIQQVWVPTEQAKHPKCGCPDHEEIVVTYWHYSNGIPYFIHGHWAKTEQGRKICRENGRAVGGVYLVKWMTESPEDALCACVKGGEVAGKISGKKQLEWVKSHPEESHRNAVERGRKGGKVTAESGQVYEAQRAAQLAHPTRIEKEMDEALAQRKVVHKNQVQIGSVRPDHFLESKTVIFDDGDYIHCNPAKFSAGYFNDRVGKTAKEIWEHDRRQTEYLESLGYKVFRFWENEIHKDVKSCVDKVLSVLGV